MEAAPAFAAITEDRDAVGRRADSEPTEQQPPALLHTGPAVAGLCAFSMLGVLVRVHLTELFSYYGQPVFALIWAQMAGCFIMGIAVRLKGVLIGYSPALNLAVTTGLCGSITTFSSWQLGIYNEFFNTPGYNHSKFKNFMGGMSVMAVTLGASVAALRFGEMVGDELHLCYDMCTAHASPVEAPPGRVETAKLSVENTGRYEGWFRWRKWRAMDIVLVLAAIAGAIAASLVVALAHSTRKVSIALLVGPVGTLVRWKLSALNSHQESLKRLVPRCLLSLPIGTFAANALGSLMLAIIHNLQNGVVIRPSISSCQVLVAMADGFCGCISTVSTFAVEITTLKPRRSILYAGISIAITQPLFILIAGIYFKTSTVDYLVC